MSPVCFFPPWFKGIPSAGDHSVPFMIFDGLEEEHSEEGAVRRRLYTESQTGTESHPTAWHLLKKLGE